MTDRASMHIDDLHDVCAFDQRVLKGSDTKLAYFNSLFEYCKSLFEYCKLTSPAPPGAGR